MYMNNVLRLLFLTAICIQATAYAQTCGTTNVALNRPVTVSNEDQYHVGAQAVDGNFSNAWFATGDTNFIYVDLGQSYPICKIKINWFSNGRGKDYLAEVSTDATNWTTIFTRTNNTSTSDSMNVTGTGRYVRIYVTAKVNTWSGLEMAELRIYNSLAGNTKPSVSLTAPANNASFFSGSNITLTATASDPDGTVTKVEFYQGTEKIGESVSSPYTFAWNNVQAGSYTLTARAYDNSNADSISVAKNITVNPTTRWSLLGNAGTSPATSFLGTTDSVRLVFRANSIEHMTILPNGFVGIGTDSMPDPTARLGVNGPIFATKLKITQSGWADYVFNKDYKLPTLLEVEAHIKKHRHLPGVPSASEVIGRQVDVGDMQEILLKKIEELTLYVIEQQKQIEELHEKLKTRAKQ